MEVSLGLSSRITMTRGTSLLLIPAISFRTASAVLAAASRAALPGQNSGS